MKIAVGLRFGVDGVGASMEGHWLPMNGAASAIADEVRRYEDAGVSEIHLLSASNDTRRLTIRDIVGAWSTFLDKARSAA